MDTQDAYRPTVWFRLLFCATSFGLDRSYFCGPRLASGREWRRHRTATTRSGMPMACCRAGTFGRRPIWSTPDLSWS